MKASMIPMRKAVESNLAGIRGAIFEGVKRIRNDAEIENMNLQQTIIKSKLVFENVNHDNIELTQTINRVRDYMDRLETEILGNKLTLGDYEDDTKGISPEREDQEDGTVWL